MRLLFSYAAPEHIQLMESFNLTAPSDEGARAVREGQSQGKAGWTQRLAALDYFKLRPAI